MDHAVMGLPPTKTAQAGINTSLSPSRRGKRDYPKKPSICNRRIALPNSIIPVHDSEFSLSMVFPSSVFSHNHLVCD